MTDEERALVDFVRENEDGLDEVEDLRWAEFVLDKLAMGGMSATELIRRCSHWSLAEKLVAHVTGMFWDAKKGRRRQELLDALAQMTSDWWQETGLEPSWFLTQLKGWKVLDHLFTHHKSLILDPEGPLYVAAAAHRGLGFVDEYWAHKVRYYIVRGDFRRAWDELNKSFKGLLNHGIVKEDYEGTKEFIEACVNPHNRGWKATYETVDKLVMELFHSMSDAGELEGSLDDFRTCTLQDEVSVFRLKGSGKPVVYMQSAERPGYDFAKTFVDITAYEDGEVRASWPSRQDHFTETGAAILLMAKHFSNKESESRRLKYERRLAEYEALQKR